MASATRSLAHALEALDPRGYETRLDEGPLRLVPPMLRVVCSHAWAPARG